MLGVHGVSDRSPPKRLIVSYVWSCSTNLLVGQGGRGVDLFLWPKEREAMTVVGDRIVSLPLGSPTNGTFSPNRIWYHASRMIGTGV
jgi:hypothetical protein